MDINHLQKAPQHSYHVNADRIKQYMQMGKSSMADQRTGIVRISPRKDGQL